jgi:hypothetical protein
MLFVVLAVNDKAGAMPFRRRRDPATPRRVRVLGGAIGLADDACGLCDSRRSGLPSGQVRLAQLPACAEIRAASVHPPSWSNVSRPVTDFIVHRSLLLLPFVVQACSTVPAPITPATPTKTPSLRASIGNKPFVARTALVTNVNTTRRMMGPCSPAQLEKAKAESEWFRTHPEAWKTCGSTANGPEVLASKISIFERVVTCDELRGSPRTTLRSNAEGVDPRSDHVDASFDDYRPSDGNGGYAAFGTVTFVDATPSEALLALDLADGSGEATARGTVRVTVCPRDP